MPLWRTIRKGFAKTMEVKNNILTEEIFTGLYASVGWEPPCEAQVRVALQNSLATFTALENGKPVGMVRLIGDGGMSFYIKDFAVHPDIRQEGQAKCSFARWSNSSGTA